MPQTLLLESTHSQLMVIHPSQILSLNICSHSWHFSLHHILSVNSARTCYYSNQFPPSPLLTIHSVSPSLLTWIIVVYLWLISWLPHLSAVYFPHGCQSDPIKMSISDQPHKSFTIKAKSIKWPTSSFVNYKLELISHYATSPSLFYNTLDSLLLLNHIRCAFSSGLCTGFSVCLECSREWVSLNDLKTTSLLIYYYPYYLNGHRCILY